MRVIHLCFQLHQPFGLRGPDDAGENKDYFETKAAFAKANAEIYQPLFAFLERNTQKFVGFRFSLLVSGPWLDLAERYDIELIERLRKLVKLGQVELVAEPSGHSLAFFYDRAELTEQVQRYRARIKKLFGVEGRIFALPELVYNDQIGKWAEDFGFAGMLVGGSPEALGWHSPNHVYEAIECRYLRLLFRNTPLSLAIMRADADLLVEKRVSEDLAAKKMVISAQKFQKRLELDMLRGNLVNLYFDAEVFKTQRDKGVIGFFDELVETWLGVQGNHFVGAAQACVAETPSMALSIKESVSWHQEVKDNEREVVPSTSALVLQSEAEARPPRWLDQHWQVEQNKALYGLRREILASEDERLIADWRRLTALDYILSPKKTDLQKLQEILADLKTRAEVVKKAQAVEISRAFTKRRDRGNVDVRADVSATAVKINFGAARAGGMASRAVHETAKQPETEVPVRRLHVQEASPSAEKAVKQVAVQKEESKDKPRGIRKVIRRLVIE